MANLGWYHNVKLVELVAETRIENRNNPVLFFDLVALTPP
jgi:hypothetical protein